MCCTRARLYVGIPKLTEKTITEPKILFNRLNVIREQGYAIDENTLKATLLKLQIKFQGP
ncbi:IclR family transcriptional regulator domain-containing protein [Desulforamulus aeronauticus]|uniref:IclR family transcriptional regulator domain-containing protein n=1 Tax=Desulforamulus aeronauticus TaxID=53343 RepID=UPI0009322231